MPFQTLLSRLSWGSADAAAAAPRDRLSVDREPDLVYAVGDVHGCLDKLRRLERLIAEDAAGRSGDKLIVCLGDYIDRGPDSAGVIDHLLSEPPEGFRRLCLAGNHEALFLRSIDAPETSVDAWLGVGGRQTLQSYGYDMAHLSRTLGVDRIGAARHALARLPREHVAFLRRLPVTFATPSLLFVHAGIRPGIPLDAQTDHDLLWTRAAATPGRDLPPGRCVVHGHTMTPTPIATGQRVAIDTGACRGGPLTAACFEGGDVRFLQVG